MNKDHNVTTRWLGEVPIYVVAFAWTIACVAANLKADASFSVGSIRANGILIFAGILVYGMAVLIGILIRHRPDSPFAYLRQRFSNSQSATWWIGALPIVLISIVLMPQFSSMKGMIPLFTDYTWDQTFIDLDRAIFLGHDPWELLWPILGNPYVTALLGVFYHLWILLLYLGTMVMLFDPRVSQTLRRQFFLSYVLCWALLGSVLATALASVGPVFAEPLLGIDTFVPQMELLRQGSETAYLMTLPVQDGLLAAFQEQARGLGAGITAMPSLHVAIAFLFWQATRQINKRIGWFFFAFFVNIWISSVHLAYHYAVDGLVSVIGMVVIWKASGAILRGWDQWLTRRDQPALRTNTVPAE